MGIASSTYQVDAHTQVDGRSYVREAHTLTTGETINVEYLAEAGADYQSIMDARATELSEALAAQEFEGIINGP